jgi:hypothetical protein
MKAINIDFGTICPVSQIEFINTRQMFIHCKKQFDNEHNYKKFMFYNYIKEDFFCCNCKRKISDENLPCYWINSKTGIHLMSTIDGIVCSKQCCSTLNNKRRMLDTVFAKKFTDAGNLKRIGKTFEEIFGKEKAETLKKQYSISMSENNTRWSKKYRTEDEITDQKIKQADNIVKRYKGKTFEDMYGIEKALEMKAKMSIKTSGKNNPMYGKPSPKKTGNGLSGHYKGIYFRSIYELSYLYYLIINNINYELAEKKKFKIHYIMDGKNRTYYPDFYLPDTDTLIEIKPKALLNTKENLLKFDAAKKAYKNFTVLDETMFTFIHKTIIKQLIETGDLIFDKSKIIRVNKYLNT